MADFLETVCPNCGRYVGAYEKCPYCGAPIPKRMSIKIFRYGSLILSIIGLFILFLIAREKEIPLIKVEDISPTMNFAYVRIKGRVIRYPKFDTKLKSLSLSVNDGTGDIFVKAYRVVGDKLYKTGKIPSIGDIIDVQGTLRIRGSQKSLTINIPEKVKISTPSFKKIRLKDINDNLLYHNVIVEGIVKDVRYYRNFISLIISDKNNKSRVKVPLNLERIGSHIPQLNYGYKIRIKGMVSYYGGYYQILPRSDKSIRVLSKKSIPFYKISDINKDKVGEIVATEGKIIRYRRFSKGISFTIADNNDKIDLVIWNILYNKLKTKNNLKKGVYLRIIGKVGEYRGNLQIVPKKESDIRILKENKNENSFTSNEKEIKDIPIGKIDMSLLNDIYRIHGKIIDKRAFSKGLIVTVKDDSGVIDVVIWDSLKYNKDIPYDSDITVVGRVDSYRGKVQLVPKKASDIIVTINNVTEVSN